MKTTRLFRVRSVCSLRSSWHPTWKRLFWTLSKMDVRRTSYLTWNWHVWNLELLTTLVNKLLVFTCIKWRKVSFGVWQGLIGQWSLSEAPTLSPVTAICSIWTIHQKLPTLETPLYHFFFYQRTRYLPQNQLLGHNWQLTRLCLGHSLCECADDGVVWLGSRQSGRSWQSARQWSCSSARCDWQRRQVRQSHQYRRLPYPASVFSGVHPLHVEKSAFDSLG